MILNALLVRWQDGYLEVTDDASIIANGPREGFLSVGNAQSADEATRLAAGVLARLAPAGEKITAEVEPAHATNDRPYGGFWVGDTITVPDSSGADAGRRVAAVTVKEDVNGVLAYFPELRP